MAVIKFYGKSKKGDSAYFAFSNFYLAPFKDSAGNEWITTEHYFQAMKFLPGDNIEVEGKVMPIREYINKIPFPREAAKEGRRRDLPMRSDWEMDMGNGILFKDAIMFKALCYKFQQHPDLAELLLSTGDAEIIEDSPIDYYWGCGDKGTGKNMLGILLMRLREELKHEQNIH